MMGFMDDYYKNINSELRLPMDMIMTTKFYSAALVAIQNIIKSNTCLVICLR